MKLRCTEEEFTKVIEEIERYLCIQGSKNGQSAYKQLVIEPNKVFLSSNHRDESFKLSELFEKIEDGMTDNLEFMAIRLKNEFSPRQLEKLKEFL